MNQITPEGIALIKQFEGFVADAYLDPVGIKTVGYGHVIKPGESITTLTEEEASAMLLADLARFGGYVSYHIKVPLNDNQFSALCSLTFNEGTAPLVGTLGTKLNAGDYEGCCAEFSKWVYAAGQKIDGLVARRQAERDLFETPMTA